MSSATLSLPLRIHLFLFASAMFGLVSFISVLNTLKISFFEVIQGKIHERIFHISFTGSEIVDSYIPFLLLAILLGFSLKFSNFFRVGKLLFMFIYLASCIITLIVFNVLGAILVYILGLQLVWISLRGLEAKFVVSKPKLTGYILTYLLLILAGINILAAINWILHPFLLTSTYGDMSWMFADFEAQFFYTLSRLSPLLFLVLLMLPVVRLLFGSWKTAVKWSSHDAVPTLVPYSSFGKLLLIFGILTSIFGTIYPFLPRLNPSLAPVSVDFKYYYETLENLEKYGFSLHTFSLTPYFSFDRLLFHVFMFSIHSVSGLPTSLTINFLPVILGPLYVIATYIFGLELFGKGIFAGLSSFLAATSYTITIGMFTGFYANWLANIWFILLLWLTLRWRRSRSIQAFVCVLLVSLTLLFTHVHTWHVVMIMLLAYIGFELYCGFSGKGYSTATKYIVLLLVVNYAADFMRSSLLGSPTGLGLNLAMANEWVNLANLIKLNENLGTTFFGFAAGFSSNFLILLLAVLGVSYMSYFNGFSKLITPLMIVCLILVMLSGAFLQGRLLYILPIAPLSVMGVAFIFKVLSEFLGKDTLLNRIFLLIVVYVSTIQLNYLLRSMAILVGFLD